MANFLFRLSKFILICGAFAAAGCASLPNTDFLSQRYRVQAAQFESALGPLSEKRSAAIVSALKRNSGNLDMLDKQIALEQEIVGSALVVGNKVALLQDGPITYAAMFTAIDGAKNHINLETYIIEDDEVGQKFSRILISAQQRGVQVNLIYDSVGALSTPRAYFDEMIAAGINVLEFNPINPSQLRKPWNLNHRDHRKLLIVDGSIAILGGVNISSVYSSGSGIKAIRGSGGVKGIEQDDDYGWRDTDIQITGPAVAEFQKLFIQTWEKQKGLQLAQKDYFPALTPQGNDIVRAIGSTPDAPYSQIYLTNIAAITNAEKNVYITNAYFVPDTQLLRALSDAAKRGVDVKIILPGKSDSGTVFHAGRSHYRELLEAGIKIYERKSAVLHVKAAVIDGVWSCVGSSNLDWRSALDNDELNAIILGRDFAQLMTKQFISDITASTEINLSDWQDRPLIFKVKESLARLVSRLL